MTEEKQEIYTEEELHQMFNTDFLPILRKFASRKKEIDKPDPQYIGYAIKLEFVFPEDEENLEYSKLQQLQFNMMPLIPKEEEEENNAQENSEENPEKKE